MREDTSEGGKMTGKGVVFQALSGHGPQALDRLCTPTMPRNL